MKRYLKLQIVIVNFRSAALVEDCLRSLELAVNSLIRAGGTVHVRLVENASGETATLGEVVRSNGWQSWCQLTPLTDNRGFAAGNNAAIKLVLDSDQPPDYFVLLNPDTVVRPGAIETLVRFMDEHTEVGIAGSRLEFPDGTPQCSAFRFHGLMSELDDGFRLGFLSRLLSRWRVSQPIPEEPTQTDWVAGACMIVRPAVFEQAGLMDEGFFMYYEEVDFCRRAKDAGWPCWYVPEARVVHLVGQSSGVTDTSIQPRRRPAYWFESRRRYFLKRGGRLYAWLADAAFALGYATWRVRRRVQRKPDRDPPYLLRDLLRHSIRPSRSNATSDG